MKPKKNTKKPSDQLSKDEILDLVASKIKYKDLFKERNEIAKKTLLSAKAEGFYLFKDLKID